MRRGCSHPVNVAPVVRDWEQTVTHIELDADAESDDTGQVEHFVHALMENVENAALMYEYTYIRQVTNAVADPNANSAGVSEDERGGIKPSSDSVLFTGVLSEAHEVCGDSRRGMPVPHRFGALR